MKYFSYSSSLALTRKSWKKAVKNVETALLLFFYFKILFQDFQYIYSLLLLSSPWTSMNDVAFCNSGNLNGKTRCVAKSSERNEKVSVYKDWKWKLEKNEARAIHPSWICTLLFHSQSKGGFRYENWCMARALSFLIRYFSNYYTLHRSDLAARAAPLDPRLQHHWILIGVSIDMFNIDHKT